MANTVQHRLRDWLLSLYQHLLPQRTLSQLMYRLTRHRIVWLTGLQIRLFARIFGVNLKEAEFSSPKDYPHFNAFFTRALGKEARPIADSADAVVSPVDGCISQLGSLTDDRLLQAKGWSYNLVELLGGSKSRAAPFRGGQFATLYLSPKDYHRIHMPLAGHLREMTYLPGRLFSVSPKTVNGIHNLFARNERVVNVFDTEAGPLAMVLVGAIFVGSIETVWAGQITPPYRHQPHHQLYEGEKAISLAKGQEMGRFNMGSTVILIFPPDTIHWQSELQAEMPVRMGQPLGQLITAVQTEVEKQWANA
ncbi:Phosphatidylserine decarboxylase [Nitrosococcus oceani ATCC 19707]|uniref:Phosphatidylserine decarboxylase proenzyme n=2 Tax=Nitrosococcus oceani TaxID=1229 RepID=PSD_NITOC|nr:archaetidylserine decarboxylase [Nitrosococcus oceani]Q3J754.1 RecName: Full=Phosphatidylserine decarboxylase proenzyme; Contains: RecName: Full=Phosphatidylserine decarboxylase alpha chain; Contains: RecName: Full=Phosphatidylserine decarboxylase beta chain [Nitrosococcus oceani ATCC 19707]KFI18228.1 phosphatidylserine decarboxylase [Nitrosococcus oceani C-27]ABA59342.1 Phosphatidylserine decarboxylase [Nitrosococcus oceani ATCC 19707]EDZ66632.1 phosphatidylserine decarboxylase [Nitrosococc